MVWSDKSMKSLTPGAISLMTSVGSFVCAKSGFFSRNSAEVMAEFRRVSRSGELRADHILAFRIAIQQKAVGPDDVLAGQSTWMFRRHARHRTTGPVARRSGGCV